MPAPRSRLRALGGGVAATPLMPNWAPRTPNGNRLRGFGPALVLFGFFAVVLVLAFWIYPRESPIHPPITPIFAVSSLSPIDSLTVSVIRVGATNGYDVVVKVALGPD